MSTTTSTPMVARDLGLKVFDSALVIATAVAALYFAGWTYRQAFYLRFSIDPSNLAGSNVAVAVEGLGAILTTTAAWLTAILPLLLMSAIIGLVARWIDRRRRLGQVGPYFDRMAIFMVRIGVSTIAILIVMAAGQVAGTMKAKDRVANVRSGKVWIYHLARQIVPGVMIAQSDDTTWLLTEKGIRTLKTSDVILIDGPLFSAVTGER